MNGYLLNVQIVMKKRKEKQTQWILLWIAPGILLDLPLPDQKALLTRIQWIIG